MSRIKYKNLIILVMLIGFLNIPLLSIFGNKIIPFAAGISILIFIPFFFLYCLKQKCPKCHNYLELQYKDMSSSSPNILFCPQCGYKQEIPELGVTFDK